jgi:hypothetical protein
MKGRSSHLIKESPSAIRTKRISNNKESLEENANLGLNASDYMKIDSKSSRQVKNQIKNSLPLHEPFKKKISTSQQIAKQVQNSMILNNNESLYLSLIGQVNTEGYFKSTKLGQTLLDVSVTNFRKASQEKLKETNLKYDNEYKKNIKSSSISFNVSNSYEMFKSQFIANSLRKENISKSPENLKKSDDINPLYINTLSPIHEIKNLSPSIKIEKKFILDVDETQLTNFEKSYSKLNLIKCDESPIENQMNMYLEESPEKLEVEKVQVNQLSVDYEKVKESTDYQSQYKRNSQNNRYISIEPIENNAEYSADIQVTDGNTSNKKNVHNINKNESDSNNCELLNSNNKYLIPDTQARLPESVVKSNEEEKEENSQELGDVEEFIEADNLSQRSKYLNNNKEPLKVSIIEVELEQSNEKQKTYDELVKKYLNWNTAYVSADEGEENSRSMSHNESVISIVDKDLDLVKSSTMSVRRKRKKIKKVIKSIEAEIKDLENHKSSEIEKIKSRKEKEISQLKEKLNSQETKKEDESMKKLYYELQTVQSNIEKKEENYKCIMKSLIDKLKLNGDEKYNNINIDKLELDPQNLEEINQVIESSIIETQNLSISKDKNDLNEYSILHELEEFKQEDFKNYNYEIPQIYQISENEVVKFQQTKNDQIIKFYTNSAIDIISKNKTLTRVRFFNLAFP